MPSGKGARYYDHVANATVGDISQGVVLYDASGNALPSAAALADGTANPTVPGYAAFQELYNGATWDRMRGANVFKTVAFASNGDNTIWTPTLGKKFRLMGYRLSVTANCNVASGGVITVQFKDAAANMGLAESVYIPTTAVTTTPGTLEVGWMVLGGNGILSAAINQALIANLSAAITTGTMRINVWGCEE